MNPAVAPRSPEEGRVHVLYKRAEIPANTGVLAIAVSVTCRKPEKAENTGSIPVSATKYQAVLPAWRKRGSGVIVNVSSVNGRVSSPLRAAYSASKFALEALTESLHLEVRHFGIRSVLIEPGAIATGIQASQTHQGPADYAGLWEQCAGADTKTTGPTGPPGPEVVALAIARAIEDPATPLRVPVGKDAEMILGLRRSLDDQAFEDAMRKAVGLTW